MSTVKPTSLSISRLAIILGIASLQLAACNQSNPQQSQTNQTSAKPTPTPAPTATPAPTTLKTAGGIEITDIQWGVGSPPAPGAIVQFRYKLLNTAGEQIDSTDGLPQPVEVRWDDPGAGTFGAWKELLQPLPAGSKAKARVPAALAFGPRGYRDAIEPDTDLMMEWEVVAITSPPTPKPTPPASQ